jgi:hypothetical protein
MVPDDPRRIVQPGCIELNTQGQCYVGMPGEKLPKPIEEARNQNQDNNNNTDNNDTDIENLEVEETGEWFN